MGNILKQGVVMNISEYMRRKLKEPVLWDRLFLIVIANIFAAMTIIAIFDWHSIYGACFGLCVAIPSYKHYFSGGRLQSIFKSGKQ